MGYRIEKSEIVRLSYGRWDEIFRGLAPDLTEAVEKKGKHVDCPFPHKHGASGGKKKFRIGKSETGSAICTCGSYNPIDLICEVNSWGFYECLQNINEFLGNPLGVVDKGLSDEQKADNRMKAKARKLELQEQAEKRRAQQEIETARKDKFKSKQIGALWEEAVSVNDQLAKPVWSYFFKRGIDARLLKCAKAIRFHQAIPFYFEQDGETKTSFHPGFLSRMESVDGELITLHQTLLDQFGNKAILPGDEQCKRVMAYPSTSVFEGCAIKLFDFSDSLGVTEGIETAFSVAEATRTPCWATYSAYGLANLDLESLVKQGLKTLHIWGDKDKSLTGQKHASRLFQRAAALGIDVHGHLPNLDIPEEDKCIDWADMHERGHAFPVV